MSGKYEKERDLERKIKNRLEDMPPIMTEYYYIASYLKKTERPL